MNIFPFTFMHVQSTYIVTSTAQTDLHMKYRTSSQKFNYLITYSEITSSVAVFKDCVYMVR